MSKPIVSLVNVEKWYGTNHVVKNMNINIAEGEFLTLLGPSGCGKTTTLRIDVYKRQDYSYEANRKHKGIYRVCDKQGKGKSSCRYGDSGCVRRCDIGG